MSFELVHKVLRTPALDLTPRERLLLATMASYGDDDGRRVYPSIAALVADTGLSRSTVIRAQRRLKAKGFIAVVGRSSVTVRYCIVVAALIAKNLGEGSQRHFRGVNLTPGGVTVTQGGVNLTPGGVTVTPNPISYPTSNPTSDPVTDPATAIRQNSAAESRSLSKPGPETDDGDILDD